jgi:hypothetical protein
MSSDASEFANFIASNAGGGGSRSAYMGPPPNVIHPPNVNLSQVGGGAPDYNVINPYLSTNVAPYIPPAASSSSNSSSAPINPYERYRNYKFSNNYDTTTMGMSIILVLEQL